jgi:hypothetical protein
LLTTNQRNRIAGQVKPSGKRNRPGEHSRKIATLRANV